MTNESDPGRTGRRAMSDGWCADLWKQQSPTWCPVDCSFERTREAAGVTLNPQKCEFAKSRVKFLGHLIDQECIRADPDKTSAILRIKARNNVTELRRFLRMVNQLGKFSPHVSELTQPLRELLSSKRSWTWGPSQEQAFSQVKSELTNPRC